MPRQVETSRRPYVVRDSVDIGDEELFLVVRSTNEKRMSLFAILAIVLQDERREPSWGDQAPLARIIRIEVNNLPSGPFDPSIHSGSRARSRDMLTTPPVEPGPGFRVRRAPIGQAHGPEPGRGASTPPSVCGASLRASLESRRSGGTHYSRRHSVRE